ncbi:hypothetical protein D3C87_1814150 [compost metagenome]
MLDQFDPLQGDRAELEFRLQGNRVDGIVGHGIDRQVFAKHIVPVEGRKTIARANPVGHHRRQHGAATQ